jgi:hypothetical protein
MRLILGSNTTRMTLPVAGLQVDRKPACGSGLCLFADLTKCRDGLIIQLVHGVVKHENEQKITIRSIRLHLIWRSVSARFRKD